MHLTKSVAVAILGFSVATLANIYPDEDPCNPFPPLEGEYRGEYDIRMNLNARRCRCDIPGPQPSETRREYDERNRIDRFRCRNPITIPVWYEPPILSNLGGYIVPIPVGGYVGGVNWREPNHWRNPRWREPSRGSPGIPGRDGRDGREGLRGPPGPPGPAPRPNPGPQPGHINNPPLGGNHNPGPQPGRPNNGGNHNPGPQPGRPNNPPSGGNHNPGPSGGGNHNGGSRGGGGRGH